MMCACSRYRDLLLNVSDAAEDPGTAHVGELQFHLRPILDLKPLAHANYSLVRDVDLDKMAQGGA